MEESSHTPKPHSAEYFGDYRDFWWNQDFLRLTAKRLKFDEIGSVLDVGCGIGHWGQILSAVLPPTTRFVGVDREEEWVTEASGRVTELGLASQFSYRKGDVNRLPFENNSFDMVTCQTVLIHVRDPKSALSEMLRVLKPGGVLLAVEPNNLVQHAVMSSLSADVTVDELTALFRFKLVCQRGKEALGLGNISLGDLLPGYFAETGAEDIQVFISDKAVPMFPPYETKEQQVHLKQSLEWNDREFWTWDKEETWKYFSAGGGAKDEFERFWKLATYDDGSFRKALLNRTYHSAGGTLMYLVSGRKVATAV